jgi:hypothetical protein
MDWLDQGWTDQRSAHSEHCGYADRADVDYLEVEGSDIETRNDHGVCCGVWAWSRMRRRLNRLSRWLLLMHSYMNFGEVYVCEYAES